MYVLFTDEHEISVGYNIRVVISLRESMGTLAPSFMLCSYPIEIDHNVYVITPRSCEISK